MIHYRARVTAGHSATALLLLRELDRGDRTVYIPAVAFYALIGYTHDATNCAPV